MTQRTRSVEENTALATFLIERSSEVSVSKEGTIFTSSPWARGALEGWDAAMEYLKTADYYSRTITQIEEAAKAEKESDAKAIARSNSFRKA